jgi:hypothetical protein
MTPDTVLERAAQAVERAASRAPEGVRDLLADDVAFLRRMDARVQGRNPAVTRTVRLAPREPRAANGEAAGRNAAIAVGAAVAAGVALAKALDWLALTEPRVR